MADETKDHDETRREFSKVVNMTPAELQAWLETEHSKDVGWPKDRGSKESVGHASGKRTIEIKHTKKADLTEDDDAHMKKVVGYVHRHMKQRPEGDVTETKWRYSLMNWGHDPLKT